MGTSSVVMGSRLRRLAESGTQTEYAEAVLGTPMDRGMRLIYEELIKTIQEGGTGADVDTVINKFMAESKRKVAAEEEAYKLREKVAAGEELDPQKAFAEYLQKILTTLMTGFQDLIAGINTIITKLNSIFGGGGKPPVGKLVTPPTAAQTQGTNSNAALATGITPAAPLLAPPSTPAPPLNLKFKNPPNPSTGSINVGSSLNASATPTGGLNVQFNIPHQALSNAIGVQSQNANSANIGP